MHISYNMIRFRWGNYNLIYYIAELYYASMIALTLSLRNNQCYHCSCDYVQIIGWLQAWLRYALRDSRKIINYCKMDLLVELWNETHRGKNYLRATWPRLIQELQVYNSLLQDLAPYSPSPSGFCPSSGKSSAALSLHHLCWAATVYSFFSLVSSSFAPSWRLFVVLLFAFFPSPLLKFETLTVTFFTISSSVYYPGTGFFFVISWLGSSV